MGTTSLNTLYNTCLARTPVAPAAVLRAAFESATEHEDNELLRALVVREDAPDDLVEQFSTYDGTSLAGLYRARAERPGNGASRRRETRAAVLARALAARTAAAPASAALIEDAFAAFEKKPTQTLAAQLRQLPAAWFTPPQAYQLILVIDTLPHRYQSPTDKLISRLGTALASKALEHVTSTWLLDEMFTWDVDAQAVISAVKRWLPSRRGRTMNGGYSGDNTQLTLHAAFAYRTPEDRAKIQVELVKWAIDHEPWAVGVLACRAYVPEDADQATPAAWDEAPAQPPSEVRDLRDVPPATLAALATSGNARTLTEVIDAVLGRDDPATIGRVSAVALRNRALTTADRHRLIAVVCDEGFEHTNALEDYDAIAMYTDDPVVTAAWASKFPEQALNLHRWDPFGGPQAAAERMRAWEEDGSLAAWSDLGAAAARAGLAKSDVLGLRTTTVNALCAVPGAAGANVSALVADALAHGLGDQSARWRTFAQLAESFPGSLGELIETAAAVSS